MSGVTGLDGSSRMTCLLTRGILAVIQDLQRQNESVQGQEFFLFFIYVKKKKNSAKSVFWVTYGPRIKRRRGDAKLLNGERYAIVVDVVTPTLSPRLRDRSGITDREIDNNIIIGVWWVWNEWKFGEGAAQRFFRPSDLCEVGTWFSPIFSRDRLTSRARSIAIAVIYLSFFCFLIFFYFSFF